MKEGRTRTKSEQIDVEIKNKEHNSEGNTELCESLTVNMRL